MQVEAELIYSKVGSTIASSNFVYIRRRYDHTCLSVSHCPTLHYDCSRKAAEMRDSGGSLPSRNVSYGGELTLACTYILAADFSPGD
jgi:hypothetical protein